MQYLFYGILLGLGAAIPIGPVNLEMIRRNLRFGTPYGIVTGLGACTADLTYLVLLSAGALTMLQYPDFLRALGVVGSLVLAWFGLSAFRSKPPVLTEQARLPSLFRYGMEGYAITLINPFTILFWASISSQISMIALADDTNATLYTGAGVMIGTVSWVIAINSIVHFTRHHLSPRVIQWLNYTGGVIILGFAVLGIWRALQL
jgi:L-lysine exporter family protein LysE/ArgO